MLSDESQPGGSTHLDPVEPTALFELDASRLLVSSTFRLLGQVPVLDVPEQPVEGARPKTADAAGKRRKILRPIEEDVRNLLVEQRLNLPVDLLSLLLVRLG